MRRYLSLCLWVGVLAGPLMAEAMPARPNVRLGAVPAWVKPAPMPVLATPAGAPLLNDGTCRQLRSQEARYLVHDEQERFAPREHQSFVHVAYRVDKSSDVQQGSELSVRYAPDFEEVTVHFARIYREERTIDALGSAEIRTIDTEVDRERFLYDAGQNVVIVLKDVRPGDVIEWAYTTSGQNPALEGHVLAVPRLGQSAGVRSLSMRVLAPTKARVAFRLHGGGAEPVVEREGDVTEYRWTQSNVAGVEDEGNAPSWHVPGPWAEFTDFSNWGDVAAWARALYVQKTALPAELEAVVGKWRGLDSEAARLFAAVRFVQEEIRYLGMEVGQHSLVPHSPAQTFERRYGDCKDKTLLLVAILERLGIRAVPALVSSREGRRLSSRLPSPLAFDHVITKVMIGGKAYWFDPTVAHERGDLLEHVYSDFYFALPLDADTRALETLTVAPTRAPLSEIEELYELGDLSGPIELTVKTTLRGARADEFRARIEQQSPRELNREYANFFAKRFDGVESLSAPHVEDDEKNNVVTIEERYRMASLFRDGEVRLTPWSFEEILAPPEIVKRQTPLGVRFPFVAEHRVSLRYAKRPSFDPPKFEAEDGAIRFVARSVEAANGHRTDITFQLRSLDDAVGTERVEEHLALRRRIDRQLELTLRRPAAAAVAEQSAWRLNGSHVGAALFGGLGLLLLQTLLRRRRGSRAQSRSSSAAEMTGGSASADSD